MDESASVFKNELSVQSTYDVTKLKNELKNVDFSHIKVPKPKKHPQWESLVAFTQQRTAEEFGSEFKLSRDPADFVFYTFPSLSYELASAVVLFDEVAFRLDDYLDRFPEDNEKIIQQFRTNDFPGNGVNDKLWRLALKVCKEVMSETALEHLITYTVHLVSYAALMRTICNNKSALTDKEYLELRCGDVGALKQFLFVLIGARIELTNELKNNPNYVGFIKQAILHVTLVNDLYSLGKDLRDEVFHYNYVYIKIKNMKYTAQSAVNDIILEIYDAERLMGEYGNRLKEMNDPKMSRYVDGIFEVIAGNHYWSTICKRYNKL